ncbi:uncharacterized protein LOC125665552 [Ostrea edulis]|uniref:uncharacterized protein LOC125665552 n=1 Tax=Ostrea edulis TaxID=37623 RepID=UPI0024AF24BD|nr:uncharacterized protein LOC125665552 [Ostrea edulis]
MMFKIIVLVLSASLSISDAIICYQCADAKDNGKCKEEIDVQLSEYQRFQNMTDLTDTKFPSTFKYLKNCTQNWGDRCLIEKIHEAGTGTLMSFIRGCTDGKVFSLSDYPNRTIVADNQTTCAYRPGSGKIVVCLTTCKTDLCNGPQPPLHDEASTNRVYFLLTITMLIITSVKQFD